MSRHIDLIKRTDWTFVGKKIVYTAVIYTSLNAFASKHCAEIMTRQNSVSFRFDSGNYEPWGHIASEDFSVLLAHAMRRTICLFFFLKWTDNLSCSLDFLSEPGPADRTCWNVTIQNGCYYCGRRRRRQSKGDWIPDRVVWVVSGLSPQKDETAAATVRCGFFAGLLSIRGRAYLKIPTAYAHWSCPFCVRRVS